MTNNMWKWNNDSTCITCDLSIEAAIRMRGIQKKMVIVVEYRADG
jgi:hypothetical protein